MKPPITLFLLLAALTIAAQDNTAPVQESLEVRMITVETTVRDAAGNPITGLTRDDFDLYINGRLENINFFQEVYNPQVTGEGEVTNRIDLAEQPGEKQFGNSFLVFIDDYFMPRIYRKPLFERMAEQIESLSPTDRMSIVRFDGIKLEQIVPWTTDRRELASAFEYARKLPSADARRRAELKSRPGLIRSTSAFNEGGVLNDGESRFRVWYNQIKKASSAVTTAMRAYYQPEGRRVMLLMSGGWPISLTATISDEQSDAFDASQLYNPALHINAMVDSANMMGYTLFPFHAAERPSGTTAGTAGRMESPGINREEALPFDTAEELAELAGSYAATLDGLRETALQTGGEVMARAMNKKDLFKAVRDKTTAYYIIGFMAENKGMADRQEIRVETNSRGARVSHRKNFRVFTDDERIEMQLDNSLLLGTDLNSLKLDVVDSERKRGKLNLTLSTRIPMDFVTQIPDGDGYSSDVVMHMAAMDTDGKANERQTQSIPIEGQRAKKGQHHTHEFSISLNRKPMIMVFTIQDRPSGRIMSKRVGIDPKSFKK